MVQLFLLPWPEEKKTKQKKETELVFHATSGNLVISSKLMIALKSEHRIGIRGRLVAVLAFIGARLVETVCKISTQT